jgi:hypothetical protein
VGAISVEQPQSRARSIVTQVLRGLDARPPLVVGAIVLAAAAIAAAFSLQVTEFEPDEIGYTHLAIGIANSLSPFTTSYGGASRLNQLYPLLIAPIWGSFNNVTAFRVTHAWNALIMASAAIPTYLLAREVVARRWAAYLAAALVAVAPWLTISTSQLTEVAAYPACAWALLAMQRSLAKPSVWRDLVALLAIGLATYGRLQLILLAPVLVVAMLLHELGYSFTGAGDRRARLREASTRMVRGHTLLTGAALVGLLVGVPLLLSGALASAFGFYGNTLSGLALGGATFDLARSYVTFMALGLAALPVALAIGFSVDALVAPVSRTAHAFASLTVIATAAVILQVAEVSVRFNGSTLQERYSFYIVPLLVVGMCAALLLSRNPARTVLIGTLVLAALVCTTSYQTQRTAFWYQVSPGLISFLDWVSPAFGASSAPSVNAGASTQLAAGLVILALGTILAGLTRRVAAPRLLASLATLAIVFCGVETVHALSEVIHGNASGRGFGGASISDANWVDRAVPSGASVAQVVGSVGALGEARALWEHDDLWNRSLTGAYSFEDFSDPFLATSSLHVERRSGAVALGNSGATDVSAAPSPNYLVVPTRGFPVEVSGSVLANAPGGKLQLLRPASPLHAEWALTGVSDDGWLALNRAATLRLYALRGRPGHCAKVGLSVTLSPLTTSDRKLRLTTAGVTRVVLLEPGATHTVDTRVCGTSSEAPQLTVVNEQSPTATNLQLTPQLQRVTVTGI